MRLGLKVLVAVVGVFLVSGVAAAMVSGPLAKIPGNPIPRSGGTSPKVHLVEATTGSWCTWCGVFDPAVNRLADEWEDSMILLWYHGPAGSSDPFSDPAMCGSYPGGGQPISTGQCGFYNTYGFPTTVVDGGGANPVTNNPLYMIGARQWTPESYMWIKTTIQNYADTSSNIAISVTGDLTPTEVTATATITATDPVPQTNLFVKFLLYEDNLFWPQTARPDGARGVAFHANVGRAVSEVALTISMGQTVTRTTTFIPQPTWNLNNLGVVAYVQSSTKQPFMSPYGPAYASDVLNAAKHDFTPSGILLYPDTGPTAEYGQSYPDLYQEALARAGERFHTHDSEDLLDTGGVNYRDLPTAAELTEAPALIWNTGALTSGALSPAERTLLRGHLDGAGSLFLTGDGLGFDLTVNDQAFLNNYLHAQYNGDNTGVFTITGVNGNPVSNAWASTPLNLVGLSSPDQINTFGPGAPEVPFRYTGGLPGSVNAGHDMNSRVVYLGSRYLDGGDANRHLVLGDVIDWLDGASAPVVNVVYPAGGESLAQGSTVQLKWTAYDVRIPADGMDIYFRDSPSNPWVPVATGEPNDGVYTWTVPMLDSPTCAIRVVARDSQAQSSAAASNDFNCGAPPLPPFTLSFTSADLGWHFISYPTQESDTTVNTILSTIDGGYSIVRWYDASNPANPWRSYIPGTASRSLASIDNTMGFWIKITSPCTLTVTGPWPTTPTAVTLHKGWNSVGFPSGLIAYTVGNLKADTGATIVQGFDSSAAPYYLMNLADSTPLVAGNAYWVYVPADTTWNVPT